MFHLGFSDAGWAWWQKKEDLQSFMDWLGSNWEPNCKEAELQRIPPFEFLEQAVSVDRALAFVPGGSVRVIP